MENIILKKSVELEALIQDKKEALEYIDKLHSVLMDYQLIINNIFYKVVDCSEKVGYENENTKYKL